MNNQIVNKAKTPIEMLLSYQVPHTYQLYECLKSTNCVLDASDTGTGKTYTTIVCCSLLNLKPFIICPKSVINTWVNVAKNIGVEILGLANYEKIKGCKYYTPDFELCDCPYLDKLEATKGKEDFYFQLPENTIIVVDEAHRCKNHKTVNSRLLMSMKESGRKILLLSATITDKLDCFRPFGVALGLYDDPKKFKIWLKSKLKSKKIEIEKLRIQSEKILTDEEISLKIIHNIIFPNKGSRMKIKELGDMFPKNQVIAECYSSDDHEKVNELYNLINKALDDLKDKEKRSSALGEIVRCRMRIEMFKLPIILDLVDDALTNGFSVVIFVNFKDSMTYLSHHLKEECSLVHGDQTLDERQLNIDDFQTNKNKIIICIIQAGGVGISLHDINGRPRMSIISPSWSGTDVVQALGRINRAGSKSAALQRIVYIAKSYEEIICQTLSAKLSVLSAINDDDLTGPKITTSKLKEIGELDKINTNIKNLDEINNVCIDDLAGEELIVKKNNKKDIRIKKKHFVVLEEVENENDMTDFNKKQKSTSLPKKYKLKK
jgi:superfamily II DNA/RNA helicase